jgi:uncharacterized repeat protein (TIGR03803 family)
LSPPGSAGGAWTETILYNFNTNGASSFPVATAGLVIGANGVLYGTGSYGGTNNLGFVYSLTPPTSANAPWTENVLYSFTGGSGGAVPYSNLVTGIGGELYGTTYSGGYPDFGTVFSLKP